MRLLSRKLVHSTHTHTYTHTHTAEQTAHTVSGQVLVKDRVREADPASLSDPVTPPFYPAAGLETIFFQFSVFNFRFSSSPCI